MTEKTGVPPSLSEHDIRQYMEKVLREIKTDKEEEYFTNENN
jgi:hypothetical protein